MWMVNADGTNPHKIANEGLINVHPAWGKAADVDGDGTPDYQQGGSFPGTHDVSMQLTAAPEPVVTGSVLTLNGTVRNFGPAGAQGVVGIFPVPVGTSLVSATPDHGSCTNAVLNGTPIVQCELGDLAPGAAASVDLGVRVDCSLRSGDVVDATAMVASRSLDTATANNTAETTSTARDTPPEISGLVASPNELWPPNHALRAVEVAYQVGDNCDPDPALALDVNSNEPVNGLGDGSTAPDWEVIDAHRLRLRAERAGSGTERVYAVTVSAVDEHGNGTHDVVTVAVPKHR
jgi:uncharacterized repeat protein (TIGR01451 family)